MSNEGVPFSVPISDEGVPFSDAGSDLEETESIIDSLAKAIVHNSNTVEEIDESHSKDPIKTCEEEDRSSMSVVRYFNSTEEAKDCRRSLSVHEPASSTEVVYAEERSTTKRKQRETDSYEPASSTEVVYAEEPSPAEICRWSERETIDMLNIMKTNPPSSIDTAFWIRMSDFLREAGHKDRTHGAVKSKWKKCGFMINTLKHLLKEEKTITFDEDAQIVCDPLLKAPKIVKALQARLRSKAGERTACWDNVHIPYYHAFNNAWGAHLQHKQLIERSI
ncbi:hypothetical protein H4Q26_012286 [Puccinia striiformis f. sp. tritici PST-130]|nr:hypothetical protein Pst134EB_026342 [Puccinia striiformis f. sp. tritici]KAI9618465.1 hypothetical protein H4Q26_012286 [Puccinia striiformis f. sp. tritici PST-130]